MRNATQANAGRIAYGHSVAPTVEKTQKPGTTKPTQFLSSPQASPEPAGCCPEVGKFGSPLYPPQCGLDPGSLWVTPDSWSWKQLLSGNNQLCVEIMEFPSILIVYGEQMISDSEK